MENIFGYKPNDNEFEKAANGYLMSVVAVVVGLPLPIVNLIATSIFFLGNRKASLFIKWHTTQALLSQATVFVFNSFGFSWTMTVLFGDNQISNEYLGYISAVVILNLYEFFATIYTASKTRKGQHIELWFWGPLTNLLIFKKFEFKKITIHFIIATCLLFGIWFSISRIDFMNDLGADELNKTKEVKLGNIMLDFIRKTDQEIVDDSIVNKLEEIKVRLCTKNNIDTGSIKLHVFYNPQINAFAMPGNHMIIYSGLIENCKNPEELSGVMAHEIAHMQHKHVMKKMVKEVGLSILITLAAGDVDTGIIKEVLKLLTSSAFDRAQETEADESGTKYLINANIDPKYLAEFLFRISVDGPDMPKELKLLSTHPDSRERAGIILEKRKTMTIKPIPLMETSEWEGIQRATKKYGKEEESVL